MTMEAVKGAETVKNWEGMSLCVYISERDEYHLSGYRGGHTSSILPFPFSFTDSGNDVSKPLAESSRSKKA